MGRTVNISDGRQAASIIERDQKPTSAPQIGWPCSYGQNNCVTAIGRKTYPFAGSHAAGDRAAAFYSLIDTVSLDGLDPEAYLR